MHENPVERNLDHCLETFYPHSLRVQVPNNRILTKTCTTITITQHPRYLSIVYLDSQPSTLYSPIYPLKGELIIGYLDPYGLRRSLDDAAG